MGFFIYSYVLEVHVINLRGQDILKDQKIVQENWEITIGTYLALMLKIYILISL